MGRHEGDDRSDRHSRSREKRSGHRRKGETNEERLLRKAKEYVEKEEQRKRGDLNQEKAADDKEQSGRRHDRSKHKKRHRDEDKNHRSSRSSGEKRRRNESDTGGSDSSNRQKHQRDDSKQKRKKHDRKDSRKREKRTTEKKHKKDRQKESKRVKGDTSKLYPLGGTRESAPEVPLHVERDYFSYHKHLWVYLYREEGRVFGDLTSEEAHAAFGRFVRRYNEGKLEAAYYDPKGIPPEAVEECKTTRHAWSFNTNETERRSLKFLQEGVRKQTDYEASKTTPSSSNKGPTISQPAMLEERERYTPQERLAQRAANKRLREHVRTTAEELTGGRKDGRERQIEKRKEKAASIHGAAKDREESAMGGMELDDDALYGGGGTGEVSFKDALAREKRRSAQRQEKKNERVSELKQKEQNKQEAMLKMLGLSGVKPGQKIKIAPRKDG